MVAMKLLHARAEAAEMLSMSLDHFERHVQPHLRLVRSGRLRLVPASELERFVAERQGFAG
jgi:excisionase family DNA binding protein